MKWSAKSAGGEVTKPSNEKAMSDYLNIHPQPCTCPFCGAERKLKEQNESQIRSSELVGRHVIGISVTGVSNTSNTQCDYVAMAVCDDGSV